MAKLKDANAWEMMSKLAELAEPVGNLAKDDAFWDVFTECTKRGVSLKQENTFRFLLIAYADLWPILMSDEHKVDTFRILAIVEGKTLEQVARMNGKKELFDSVKDVFNETILPFFTYSGLSAITG